MHRCDVCDLPDLHNGAGDGIGSCMCHRCACGQAEWSALCTCPPDYGEEWPDDEVCVVLDPVKPEGKAAE